MLLVMLQVRHASASRPLLMNEQKFALEVIRPGRAPQRTCKGLLWLEAYSPSTLSTRWRETGVGRGLVQTA